MSKSKSVLDAFTNPVEFNEVAKEQFSLPTEGIVMSFTTGQIEAKDDKPAIPYASLQCAESDEYELYSQINRTSNVPTFKVKLRGFNNQDLSSLVGQTLDLSNAGISFKLNRLNQPIGVDLILSMEEVL
ncbi:hypothetical protein [Streptococcus ruminantium]|uniref:hypothetical protein n=1 Tax=Streptococcus ruminantium TaxID=1917441 RepID=UPI0012DE1530|nr:hypothetical protein [Streptococcus ruminantium]